ncbi:MAG: DUF420 domain-containing protein [bacterium]|nr:DUF420 domain-containing protein [Candidatus Kapabacteria bacterium]
MNGFDVMMLPALNATLNAIAGILLIIGFIQIRNGKRVAHRRTMIAAFSVSVAFLASYVTYHAMRGGMNTPFGGEGGIRTLYYAILITHVILAAIVPVLAIITLRRGLAARYDKHRRIARWTLPIWLYVSVTGVIVYFMLYQWYPAA